MKCPKCQSDLPETARFCGMCGHKFAAAPEPSVGAEPLPPVVQETFTQDTTSNAVRFFRDTTSETNAEHNRELLALQERVLHTPSPHDNAVAAAVAKARVEANEEPSVDPVTRQPFEFRPDELARALGRAAARENKPPPTIAAENVTQYYQAGLDAGLDRKVLEQCLHEVALERVAPGAQPQTQELLRAPMTEEFEPIQPSRKKIAMVGGGIAALLVGGIVAMSSGGGEEPKPAEPPATTAEAPPANEQKRKTGQMDTSKVGPAIAALGEKAKACHQEAQKRNPKAAGKLVFDVELEETGSFSKLDIKDDTVGDTTMAECVRQLVRAHDWPRPTGGYFAMEFPLSFQATQAPAPAKKKKRGKKH